MLKNIIKIISFLMLFSLFTSVSALKIEGDVKLEKVSPNSFELSFDDVEGAIGYYLYYDTVASEDGTYSYEGDEVYETTPLRIENLDPSTKYYMAIEVFSEDSLTGELSDEFSFTTLAEGEEEKVVADMGSLELSNIALKNTRVLDLEFNSSIDSEAAREFLVVNKNDETEDIVIESSNLISDRNVEVILASDLEILGEYSITIISLTGANGENIEFGVDGLKDFIVEEDTPFYQESIIIETANETEDLQVSNTEDENDVNLNAANAEEELIEDELSVTVTKASKEAEKLPDTGAEHVLLLLIALIISGFFFFRKRA